MKGYDIMKTIETRINQNLESLKSSKYEKIEEKIADLKESFIMEQVKSFNIDLGNKTAQNTIAQWESSIAFQLCVTGDRKELTEDLSKEVESELAELTYYAEVERIANRRMANAIRPITQRLGEMLKSIMKGDIENFNIHMTALFGVELSQANFDRCKDMIMSGRKSGLNTMSSSQFANTFMHLMLARAIQGGAYSPKKVKGALNKAIKDVPTLTFSQAMNLDTLTVDEMIEACGIRIPKDAKDNFIIKSEKVRAKLHTLIAVKPDHLA